MTASLNSPVSSHGHDPLLRPDDRQIIRLLARDFILLTAEDLSRLLPHRPRRSIFRRLRRLLQLGYLSVRNPTPSVEAAAHPAYYLTPKSAEIVSPGTPDATLPHRSQRARTYTDVPHLHLINRIQIAFRTPNYPDYQLVSWIHQDDPLWTDMIRAGHAFRPDALAHYTKSTLSFLAFIEADRASYHGAHLIQRLQAYRNYANKNGPSPEFEFSLPRFRVLFVTETTQRTKQLLQHFSSYHSDLFWVASWNDFSRYPIFNPHWYSHASATPHSLEDPYVLPPTLPDPPLPSDLTTTLTSAAP